MKFLVVGLGNPGEEYTYTRHNIGFLVSDKLVSDANSSFETNRHGVTAQLKHKGKSILVLKPNTYMNLSGKAVRYYIETEKIKLENILIITDDLAIPFGSIRIRKKGSDGGHNGLKSINEILGTNEYARMRFGIGSNFNKGTQVDYVLGNWSPEESKELAELIDHAAKAVYAFTDLGIDRAMNFFNK